MSYDDISDETTDDAIAEDRAARKWRVECPECGTVCEWGHSAGCPNDDGGEP